MRDTPVGRRFISKPVKWGSGTMVHKPISLNISSGTQELLEGNTQKHRQHGDLISLLLLFENMESMLKTSWLVLL
jgi:hypothetical protein